MTPSPLDPSFNPFTINQVSRMHRYTSFTHRCRPLLLLIAAMAMWTCTPDLHKTTPAADTLWQTGTLQALLDGEYDGRITVAELQRYGDFGVGTFDRIDGEMVVLNDTVWQCRWDGSVRMAQGETTVPFADVLTFEGEHAFRLSAPVDITVLTAHLDSLIDTFASSADAIYAVRATGTFETIDVRSELPQTPPYQPLAEVLATDQREYHYTDLSGTLVAMRTPDSMAQSTGSGWHFHFVSADRTQGGHVLTFTGAQVQGDIDCVHHFGQI